MRYSVSTAVTPSDTVDIWPGTVADAIFVAGTGNLTLVLQDGSEIAIAAAGANTIWPFATKRVKAGATATGIRGLKY
jgi:hypothetical protein